MKKHLRIYATRIPRDISNHQLTALSCQVAPERQAKIKRFVKKDDALRSIGAELLLCRVALPTVGIQAKQLTFTYNQYGKPALVNYPDIHFNLSHSGNLVVCALDRFPVGIDVEEIQPIDLSVAQNCLTKNEFAQLLANQEEDRRRYFYDLWTIKESYVKAVGTGLSLPLNSFGVEKKKSGEISIWPTTEKWYFHQYEPEAGYVIAVCASHCDFPRDLIWTELEEFKKL